MNVSTRCTCLAALLAVLSMSSAHAQTAFRCDNNGQTVYSDTPCPTGKAIVGTQDSAEQKAAAKDANAQVRKDNADLNKRLSEREKLEAQERAAARKAALKKSDASAKPKASAKAKSATKKAKTPKQRKQATDKKKKSSGAVMIASPK